MHWSACAYAHADKCFYFKQVHMLTHAAYHFNTSVQSVIDKWQVSRAPCNFGRKQTWCPWWHKVHMNQLEICQARYRSNTWMGRTRTDSPDEFEPSKFDCISVVLLMTNHETPYNLKILCWASTHLLSQSLPFLQLQVCVCASTNIQLSFSSTRTALQNKDQT